MRVVYLESTKHIQDNSLSFAYLCGLCTPSLTPDMQKKKADVQVGLTIFDTKPWVTHFYDSSMIFQVLCSLKPLTGSNELQLPTWEFSLSITWTELMQYVDMPFSCPLYSHRGWPTQYLDKCEKTKALCCFPVWHVIVKHQNKYQGREPQTFLPATE